MNIRILKEIRRLYVVKCDARIRFSVPYLSDKIMETPAFVAVHRFEKEVVKEPYIDDFLSSLFTNVYGLFYSKRLMHIRVLRRRQRELKKRIVGYGINPKELVWMGK